MRTILIVVAMLSFGCVAQGDDVIQPGVYEVTCQPTGTGGTRCLATISWDGCSMQLAIYNDSVEVTEDYVRLLWEADVARRNGDRINACTSRGWTQEQCECIDAELRSCSGPDVHALAACL